MCRQFVTAGKLSKLRKILEDTYNEEIRIKLYGEIEEEEKELEEEIDEELEEQRKHKREQDAMLTENIPVITYNKGKKFLTRMKWGIRFDPENKSPLIFNSRDDTIKEKPFWQKIFDQNRILIPMFGFYEWVDKGKKKKQKLRSN
ncbi:MAG: SOS response-associated peptidase family protein [Ignavibacteria bacterium]|nr:SOS response-associated peptidase family protein [Ignavibacteria bacterium]